jgi:hypothetical protein|tara:strand:- start:57 stop:359 length:303 start_codon:yes stop_codon:yes gene_type:complete
MSYFAKINNEIVEKVIVAEQNFIDIQEGTWVQTSYNGNFRKNYAGIGYTYDETRDAFYTPQPYPSWTLNETTCQWEAPTPYPDDDERYIWDEDTLSWVEE